MDNKEKLNKPENNEEFIIPEFEDYQSKKKPDVDEVIKKLNERITALEAEENTFEEIKEILENIISNIYAIQTRMPLKLCLMEDRSEFR